MTFSSPNHYQRFNPQDSELVADLHQISQKSPRLIRSHVYSAPSDPSVMICSWKMNEFKYYDVPSPFPTLARGLFTRELQETEEPETEGSGNRDERPPRYQIVARGYDKFFNIGKVPWTDTRPSLVVAPSIQPTSATNEDDVMRPLSLHVSALSDAEYNLYTASLDDLATDSTNGNSNSNIRRTTHVRDDARYERTSVGVREARAWLRGRFSDLPASDIEAILKLFCPNMLSSDMLTGGEFFAALRLVIHADSGKAIDRTLAFVQAFPRPAKSPDPPQQLSPPKRPVQAPPPAHPDRQKPPPPLVSPSETNPFARRSVEHATAPTPAPPLPADPDPPPLSVFPQKRPSKISHNPFLARDKPETSAAPTSVSSQARLPPLPPRKPAVLAAPSRRASETVLPTSSLVLVKPTHVMSPLMRQSLEASKHAQSMKRAEEQLDRERVLQVLKSTTTSTASTTSGSSSSCNTTPSTRTRSLSPAKQSQRLSESDDTSCVPPLPRRRKPSLPLSSRSSSVLSLDQVANATLPSPIAASATSRPPLPSREHVIAHSGVSTTTQTDCLPPPTHPAHRRPSASTMTTTDPTMHDADTPRPRTTSDSSESPPLPAPPPPPRLGRSNSLAASFMATNTGMGAGASMPLPPPPRRKRPESVQVSPTAGSDMGDLAFARYPTTTTAAKTHERTTSYHGQGPGQRLSRHLSLTREREKVKERGREHHRESSFADPTSPFSTVVNVTSVANIQRTFANLQPKLDAVRYKAEAGLSKRGYVHHAQLGSIIRRRLSWREEGEEELMADTRCSGDDGRSGAGDKRDFFAIDDDSHVGHLNHSEPTMDSDEMFGYSATDKKDAPYREVLSESDNLKWPMGQGWKPL